MGRWRSLDAFFDAWLVLGLNIPALVTIILCYVWFGLNDWAAILAVAINKIVSASFPVVRYPATVAVTSAKITAYRSASTSSAKLLTLPAGSSVLVYRWDDTWARIGRDKGYAYVKVANLVMSPLLSKPICRMQVTASKVNIRASASSSAAVMAKAWRGNQFAVLSATSKWVKVQYNGAEGYIEKRYLKKL